ncbi:hypothetical protein HanIR_Chr13g0636391 [Helianthus annuus]|nr:hypothetical protein HanIR_Chr13g0636391 [Helianthus annuus]
MRADMLKNLNLGQYSKTDITTGAKNVIYSVKYYCKSKSKWIILGRFHFILVYFVFDGLDLLELVRLNTRNPQRSARPNTRNPQRHTPVVI